MKNHTEDLIAEALMEMAKTKELENIQVVDICRRIGCSKQTFYNHFRDKYDVVAWVFSKNAYLRNPAEDCYYSLDALTDSLAAIWDNRDFFRVAFISEGQNSLYEYIVSRDIEFNGTILLKALHLEQLNDEMVFLLKYHIHGCLGYVSDWLRSENPISPRELAELEYEYMPKLLKNAWAVKADC